jgi:hypothetical protein
VPQFNEPALQQLSLLQAAHVLQSHVVEERLDLGARASAEAVKALGPSAFSPTHLGDARGVDFLGDALQF